MIHNLKVLIAAAMTLAAFGALSATAHAAEEKFHCSVEPCTVTLAPDEAAGGTTAHHVFVVKGTTAGHAEIAVTLTCNQLTGEATSSTKTATELTFTNLTYENTLGEPKCKVGASETVSIDTTSCDYRFTSTGGGTTTGSQVHLLCGTAGDGIDVKINGVLCLKLTPATATGIGYHDSGIGPAKSITTATINASLPVATVMLENKGNATCTAVGLGLIATLESFTYTTGNTLIRPDGGASDWFE